MKPMTLKSLNAVHVFCRVLELSSFRQAADHLQMPVATVSNQIKSLEARLGVRLLIRSSRHVEPTEEGLAYYRRVVPLLEGLDEAEQVLRDTQARPAGRLHVSMPASVVRLVIAPHLNAFQTDYPDISLRIVATDRVVDMAAEGVDCAIRAVTPALEGLVVQPLARIAQFFAASPALVLRHGEPRTLEELARLPFINYAGLRGSKHMQVWAARARMPGDSTDVTAQVKPCSFSATSPLSIDDGSAYVELACAGLGVIQSPAYDLNAELAAGRLQVLLPGWRGPDIPFHAVYAKGRAQLPRVRAFVDWVGALLLEQMISVPWGMDSANIDVSMPNATS